MPNPTTYLTDTEYTTETIEKSQGMESYLNVQFKGGTGLGVSLKESQVPLEKGDVVRLYGRGFGQPVRGVALEENGVPTRVYYYMNREDYEQERVAKAARALADRAAEYKAKEPEYRARIAALPEVFQDRFARFEKHCGEEWMVENLTYELFTCEQAVLIAGAGIGDFAVFRGLPWDEQKAAVPGLDDGHSGNTFGASLNMAAMYTQKAERVPFAHAAIHGLLGCEKAGCWAARHERTGEIGPDFT